MDRNRLQLLERQLLISCNADKEKTKEELGAAEEVIWIIQMINQTTILIFWKSMKKITLIYSKEN